MSNSDRVRQNIEILAASFPHCVTEARHEVTGEITRMVDFDRLRQEFSGHLVEGPRERYELNWPGKRQALLTAQLPSDKILHPCRDESVEFDSTGNLYIEGDNLEVLKILQDSYANSVKMIYIDPPYNTGRGWIYDDRFAESSTAYRLRCQPSATDSDEWAEREGRFHSEWLSMMYARLKLARQLLKDDGVLLISIDENELYNLWLIGNEIFGRENFVECMAYQKKAAAKGVPPRNMIAGVHEYILCFQKSASFAFLGTPRSAEGFENPDQDPRGPWRNTNCKSTVKDQSQAFAVVDPQTGRKFADTWAHSPQQMQRMAEQGVLIFPANHNGQVRKKEYFEKFANPNVPVKSWLGLYDAQENTQSLAALMGKKIFPNPKSLRLMTDIVRFTLPPGEMVLDFFSGSATTAHAVLDANASDGGNRSFAMVQLPQACQPRSNAYRAGFATIAEIGKQRIRRAAEKLRAARKPGDPPLDLGFRVLKLADRDPSLRPPS